jgi:elongation factor P
MKIDVSEAKRGVVLDIDGQLYKVIDVWHTHMWRGGATYTLKVKNIITGANNMFTYKSGISLTSADVGNMSATYLYAGWDTYAFMENDTWEIYDLSEDLVLDSVSYLKENLNLFLIKHNDNVIWITLPDTISYAIVETLPWDRWDRATAWRKEATLENWLVVQVPLHAKEWDQIIVNTITWQAQ